MRVDAIGNVLVRLTIFVRLIFGFMDIIGLIVNDDWLFHVRFILRKFLCLIILVVVDFIIVVFYAIILFSLSIIIFSFIQLAIQLAFFFNAQSFVPNPSGHQIIELLS